MRRLLAKIPLVASLRRHDRAALRGDAVAGLTTAVMLIPQGMAYAMLAGLPPVVGLYASTVPLVVYALLGSSRQLAVGPVAMDSILVASGVGALAAPGSGEYVGLALLLAAMVGAIELALGLARLGWITNLLSRPVVRGFSSAAAILIATSQLPHLLGLSSVPGQAFADRLVGVAARLGEAHLPTVAIGLLSIAALLLLRRFGPRLPRALLVVAAATLAVGALGLADLGVAVVGQVPSGLPTPSLPPMTLGAVKDLLPTALAIALVGIMEAVSVGGIFAERNGYDLDANRELIGLGAANLAGSFFRGYPVTGGFSRTAVNAEAGARSGLAALVTAGTVALTLLLFTRLFHDLPKAVLAAIITVAVAGLVDLRQVPYLWKVKRSDLAMLALTFVATLALGIEEGILIGVGASLLGFIRRSNTPHLAILGRLPGTEVYRNLDRFPQARTVPGVLILRVDAPFYFGNVSFLKKTLPRLVDRSGPLDAVVVDASGINDLDSSADAALQEIARDLLGRGIDLRFAGVRGPVRDVMQRSGFAGLLGPDRFAFRVHDAVLRAVARAQNGGAA